MHFMGFNDYQGDGDRNNGLAAVLFQLALCRKRGFNLFFEIKGCIPSSRSDCLVGHFGNIFLAGIVLFIHGWLRLREVPENPGIAVGTPSSIPILSPESWPSSSAWFSRSQPFSFGIPCIKAARTRWGSGFSVYSRSCFSFMRFPSYW